MAPKSGMAAVRRTALSAKVGTLQPRTAKAMASEGRQSTRTSCPPALMVELCVERGPGDVGYQDAAQMRAKRLNHRLEQIVRHGPCTGIGVDAHADSRGIGANANGEVERLVLDLLRGLKNDEEETGPPPIATVLTSISMNMRVPLCAVAAYPTQTAETYNGGHENCCVTRRCHNTCDIVRTGVAVAVRTRGCYFAPGRGRQRATKILRSEFEMLLCRLVIVARRDPVTPMG